MTRKLGIQIILFLTFFLRPNITYSQIKERKEAVFFNSVIYGIGAGTLVGLANLTNFKRNFSKNVDWGNVARGASYGLYAGILLGFYLNSKQNAGEEEGVGPTDTDAEKEPMTQGKRPVEFFHVRSQGVVAKLLPKRVDYFLLEDHSSIFILNWELARF